MKIVRISFSNLRQHLMSAGCGLVALSRVVAQAPDTLRLDIGNPGTAPQIGPQQGFSVAIHGTTVVVGAPYDDTGAQNAGVVKVYDGETGALLHVLRNPSPASGDNFGYSVAIHGTRVVVGAPFDDTSAPDAGGAYVFDLLGNTPTSPILTLQHPTAALHEYFGHSVAISEARVVVGSPGSRIGGVTTGMVFLYDPSSPTPTVSVWELANPTPGAGDRFGSSVAADGQLVVVGAPEDDALRTDGGTAYIYNFGFGTFLTTLGNPNAAGYDFFGNAVAVSGNRVVVGAYRDYNFALEDGSAFVFSMNSPTPGLPVATLRQPTSQGGEQLGGSVSISGSRVVVGAAGDDSGAMNSGIALVYDLANSDPTTPTLKLVNPNPHAGDGFGGAVAAYGSKVVVGAPSDNFPAEDAGSAFVYNVLGGTPMTPTATLSQPSPGLSEKFGWAVAVAGRWCAVGANADDTSAVDAGRAYIFDLAGVAPSLPAIIFDNPEPATGDIFGYAVAIDGTHFVVGAPSDDAGVFDSGSVYVYDLARATPAVPVFILRNPAPAAGDGYGRAVAASGPWVVVGAYGDSPTLNSAGSAFVYNLAGATPTVPVITLLHPSPFDYDYFGWSVAVSGNRVVVGAPAEDAPGIFNSGSAFVFDLTGVNPTVPVFTLNNPAPADDDSFGGSVAMSGSWVVVGAHGDNQGALDSGAAYVYDLGSVNPPIPAVVLHNPAAAASDWFGSSVAVSGNWVVVGAVQDDPAAGDSGGAFVYDVTSGSPTAPVAILAKPSPAQGDWFGSAVAMHGSTITVGAYGVDGTSIDRGAAFIFGPDKPQGIHFLPVTHLGGIRYGLNFAAIVGGPLIAEDAIHLEPQAITSLPGVDWATLTNVITINDGVGQVEITTTNNPPRQFYQIKVQ